MKKTYAFVTIDLKEIAAITPNNYQENRGSRFPHRQSFNIYLKSGNSIEINYIFPSEESTETFRKEYLVFVDDYLKETL